MYSPFERTHFQFVAIPRLYSFLADYWISVVQLGLQFVGKQDKLCVPSSGRALVQMSYAFSVAKPLSFLIETDGVNGRKHTPKQHATQLCQFLGSLLLHLLREDPRSWIG